METTRLARLERDLHDGTQARFVAVTMLLDLAMAQLDDCDGAKACSPVGTLVAAARDQARDGVTELRALLSDAPQEALADTLEAALTSLAAGSVVPVRLTVELPDRLAPKLRDVLYYCVAELLTNIAKHASATRAWVEVAVHDGFLTLTVRDDGVGGAHARRGHRGLPGLADRVAAVGGILRVTSPAGGPTTVEIRLPADPPEPF